jgi:tetratricopeptide (TPR) repeat protein
MILSRLALLVSIAAFTLGCGGSKQAATDARLSASESFQAAEDAFDRKEFSLAESEYSNALKGGLYIDLLDTALAKRAVSRAELGNLDQALQDLNEQERRAVQLDIVYAAKSYVLGKQGKTSESRAAWSKAQRINRSIQEFGK